MNKNALQVKANSEAFVMAKILTGKIYLHSGNLAKTKVPRKSFYKTSKKEFQ
jgi:hypothetical protein